MNNPQPNSDVEPPCTCTRLGDDFDPSAGDSASLEELVGPVRALDEASSSYAAATLLDRRRAYHGYQQASNGNGERLSVRLAVGCGSDLNAVAALCNGVHWIVVWDGLLQAIEHTISALAASAASRDLFGSGLALDADALANLLDSPSAGSSTPELLLRATPANAMRATFMVHAALRFICDHEFFHAFHGHVLLVNELFDRPVIPQLARLAQPLEPRIRMALEMEADRSAVFAHFLDLAAGDGPGNPVIDAMTPTARIHLATVAVSIVLALLAKGEEPVPDENVATHPGIEARLFMLLESTFVRALQMAGFDLASIVQLHNQVLASLSALESVHSVFAVYGRATDERLREHHQIGNRRLEMAYRLYALERLRRHSFFGVAANAVAATGSRCEPSV